MKRLIAFLAIALSLGASAATLNPVQLLNPAGSSSGQAIISTGSSSAPAWSSINAATLGGATFAAPGPIGSTTASTGAFTTLNSVGGALNGSLGSGTPAGANVTTLNASGLITPSSTIGIKGTATNDSAQAGSVGEYVTASASTVSLTNGTAANITSISLTAGDWDVSGVIQFNPAGTTVMQVQNGSISTTSAAQGPLGSNGGISGSQTAGNGATVVTPVVRLSIASTTTVFLVANTFFSTSTCTGSGVIRARRVR
jgi:hypothetical protein